MRKTSKKLLSRKDYEEFRSDCDTSGYRLGNKPEKYPCYIETSEVSDKDMYYYIYYENEFHLFCSE